MPIFDNFLSKLSQVNLTEINHKLGKAKENYLQNFQSDGSHVGSLIRSESTRFGSILGSKERIPALPKSASLPVIQTLASPEEESRPGKDRTKFIGNKYKYRSTAEGEGPISSPQDILEEDSVVDRFIKVVGIEENKKVECADTGKGRSLSSREDIRKKLASFGEEDTICEEDEECDKNNLEICFINEIASDDEDVMFNPLTKLSDGETKKSKLSQSSSDWGELEDPVSKSKNDVEELKSAAAVSLGQCGEVARRQLAVEKKKKHGEDTIKKLIGVHSSELTEEKMARFNVNTLQVILNDFRDKIEQNNTELVTLLMQKDELENEQDSMVMDMEDIPHSSLI